jgi:hypothetical protein
MTLGSTTVRRRPPRNPLGANTSLAKTRPTAYNSAMRDIAMSTTATLTPDTKVVTIKSHSRFGEEGARFGPRRTQICLGVTSRPLNLRCMGRGGVIEEWKEEGGGIVE